ncbi:MAG TPA: ATP-binding protein, partial [Ignavibacteriaceae bacterium]
RRIIIISLILAAISIILLSVLFSNQNLNLLTQEYSNFKSFTNSFLQNMKEAVITVSRDMKITLFNLSAENLFSVRASEIIGKNINETGIKSLDIISENIRNEITYQNIELSVENGSTTKFISLNIIPNYNLDKQMDSYTIIINDITELKNTEEQIKRNEKILAMGELASGVAHEIRNPINAIGMIAQRLNKEFEPKENNKEYLDITLLLKNEVDRINKIITQFLSYAKPLEINQSPVELNLYLSEVFKLYEEQAKQKSINFILQGSEKVNVNIDADLIKQSLMNIIQNAFDSIEENGEVSISYYRHKKDFVIEITDNGVGIDQEQQKKIFDLYYTTKKDGNGLGLSISQKIIAQHKGSIAFKSKLNQGTTFKIILPIK